MSGDGGRISRGGLRERLKSSGNNDSLSKSAVLYETKDRLAQQKGGF